MSPLSEGVEFNLALNGHADHLCHLVVHGMLHLLGYDHQTASEADRMERLEVLVLCGLGVASPYEDRAEQ